MIRVRQRQRQKTTRQHLCECRIFHHRLPLKGLLTQMHQYRHLQMNHKRLYRASMQKESVKKELEKMSNKGLNVLLMIVYAKCRLDKTHSEEDELVKTKTNPNEAFAWLMTVNRRKLLVKTKMNRNETHAWHMIADIKK